MTTKTIGALAAMVGLSFAALAQDYRIDPRLFELKLDRFVRGEPGVGPFFRIVVTVTNHSPDMAETVSVDCTGLNKAGKAVNTGGVDVKRVGPGQSASGEGVMPVDPQITRASCRVTGAMKN